MRATCEIVADLKDGKEVPYEELKMACLVQSSIIFFYQQDTKNLLKGGIAAVSYTHLRAHETGT